jgi:hypothetical protein
MCLAHLLSAKIQQSPSDHLSNPVASTMLAYPAYQVHRHPCSGVLTAGWRETISLQGLPLIPHPIVLPR